MDTRGRVQVDWCSKGVWLLQEKPCKGASKEDYILDCKQDTNDQKFDEST